VAAIKEEDVKFIFMILFDKEIPIRTHHCSVFDQPPKEVEIPYVNLYIRFKGCNAKCKFCEYSDTANKFNIEKFKFILEELKKNISIKKVSLTGGEPTLNFDKFKEITLLANEILNESAFVLNTNGFNLQKIFNDEVLGYIDNISISRHHYNDDLNNEILGLNTIRSSELKEYAAEYEDTELLHFSCNLTKGYIDSKKEILKYLEYTNDTNVHSVGFVQLMPINDYCKEHFVHIDLDSLLSKRFNLLKRTKKLGACECNNYVYIPKKMKNSAVRVYYKNTYFPEKMINDLTFDGENLFYGFDGVKIV